MKKVRRKTITGYGIIISTKEKGPNLSVLVINTVTTTDNWSARNISSLKTVVRIIFGVFWVIDGALKFDPGFVDTFPNMIKDAASGQPSWLAGWFSFWASITSSNPAFHMYSIGLLEVALAFCLIFGFVRKLSYTVSLFLSLII
jgi:uncharacterized membrane protein YphA (DoxX/SURF4 family)